MQTFQDSVAIAKDKILDKTQLTNV